MYLRARAMHALLALVALAVWACDRRELELYTEGVAAVHIGVDWDAYFAPSAGSRPTGMTLLVARDGDTYTQRMVTNSVDGHTLMLPPGTYRLLVMNQSFDEFGSMTFHNTDSHHLIEARATSIVTRQTRQWDQGVVYMREPEPLGVAVDTLVITPQMVEQTLFYPYKASGPDPQTAVLELTERPFDVGSVLNVGVRIKGIQNMRAVEGSITGMADGCRLSLGWRNETQGTLLLDSWHRMVDDDDPTMGWIYLSTPTFGLPHGKEQEQQRDASDSVIRLAFTLIDGSQRLFTYNVGKALHYRYDNSADSRSEYSHRGMVALELELLVDAAFDFPVLPDVVDDGGGGFGATVDDWEEADDISIGV